ncbi:hypothetical protein F4861DRAFT_446083 [Xylaria intraflava]|nr:hypothetical protein F4861DRAFT_446083 [Xylaria intraflava]
MGSLAADAGTHAYPDARDSSLVLTHPTPAEMEQTWRMNHNEWGGALDVPAYLVREPLLASTALASDGGMVHWILSESSPRGPDGKRRVLASCETLRKRVLYAQPGTDEVREGLNYGIGSVYTYPEYRGRKYAARMLEDLGAVLRTRPKEEQKRIGKPSHAVNGATAPTNGHEAGPAEEAVSSALWSDIGKRFYASKGWPAFPSDHIEFPCAPAPAPGIASLLEQSPRASLTLTPVNDANLAQLCDEDEAQLRGELLRHARASRRTAFAFAPMPDVMRWHWAREDFVASQVFPDRGRSEVKGVVAAVDGTRARMWAVWTRKYSVDASGDAAKNTLYILRFVIVDDDADGKDDDAGARQLAFDAILRAALDAARSWHCGAVHFWNPSTLVRGLAASSGVPHAFVHRDVDSIPSMMWYGPGPSDEVDWVANEKYCWC